MRKGNGSPQRLDVGVWSVGATSFFSDSGHEIATSLLPGFVTGVLHGSAAALGVIEGLSDALTGLAKVVGGPLSDEPSRRRRIATGGYLATAIATGAIGLTFAVWQAAVLRAFAWLSRGLRSPARDGLVTALAPSALYGRAFGIERAGDNLGAVAGPLLAAALVAAIGIRPAIWVAAVPGVLAAVTIGIAARRATRIGTTPGERPRIRLLASYAKLRGIGLARVMAPIAAFECGNLAVTLLILRSTGILEHAGIGAAAAVPLAIVIYAGHNAVAAAAAYGGGALVDRIGGRTVLMVGAGLYVIAYVGLAIAPSGIGWLILFFALAGCGIGCGETAQSALVAHAVPAELRGTGFGALGLVQAAGDLLATLVAGVLFTVVGPAAAFAYAAAWMLLAAVLGLTIRAWRPPASATRAPESGRV